MIRYLVYNEVLEIYREQISKHGGFAAIRDNNALLSVIVNPQREFNGAELYPTIPTKAAILVYSMNKNHPFVEGNKRTAFACGRVFLRLNGYDVCSLEDYYNVVRKIARDEIFQDDVFEWFELSIKPIPELLKLQKKDSSK